MVTPTRTSIPRLSLLLPNSDAVAEPRGLTGDEHDYIRKYKPMTIHELCVKRDIVIQLTQLVESVVSAREKVVVCHGPSGSGKRTTVELVLTSLGYMCMEVNCSLGINAVTKQLQSNTYDVLRELNGHRTNSAYVVIDIVTLNRTERSTLIAMLRKVGCVSIISCRDPVLALPSVHFQQPTAEQIELHLWWIVFEECLDVTESYVQTLAQSGDVSNAVVTLQANSVFTRDSVGHDAYNYVLCLHETMPYETIDMATNFVDTLSMTDILDHAHMLETRASLLESAAVYASAMLSDSAKVKDKHSYMARNAQIQHRIKQLRLVCESLGVQFDENIDIISYIVKTRLLRERSACGAGDMDLGWRAELPKRALYLLAKKTCKISEARILKNFLSV
jgi:hypothetical protein